MPQPAIEHLARIPTIVLDPKVTHTSRLARVHITTAVTGAAALLVQSGGRLSVAGLKLVSSGAGATAGLKSSGSAVLVTGAMDFGAANRQMQAAGSGSITFGAGVTYNISAGAVTHIFCSSSGNVAIEGCTVTTTGTYGVAVEHVEALAFAWLAREALAGRPGNLPGVTGARGLRILGAIYPR